MTPTTLLPITRRHTAPVTARLNAHAAMPKLADFVTFGEYIAAHLDILARNATPAPKGWTR